MNTIKKYAALVFNITLGWIVLFFFEGFLTLGEVFNVLARGSITAWVIQIVLLLCVTSISIIIWSEDFLEKDKQ